MRRPSPCSWTNGAMLSIASCGRASGPARSTTAFRRPSWPRCAPTRASSLSRHDSLTCCPCRNGRLSKTFIDRRSASFCIVSRCLAGFCEFLAARARRGVVSLRPLLYGSFTSAASTRTARPQVPPGRQRPSCFTSVIWPCSALECLCRHLTRREYARAWSRPRLECYARLLRTACVSARVDRCLEPEPSRNPLAETVPMTALPLLAPASRCMHTITSEKRSTDWRSQAKVRMHYALQGALSRFWYLRGHLAEGSPSPRSCAPHRRKPYASPRQSAQRSVRCGKGFCGVRARQARRTSTQGCALTAASGARRRARGRLLRSPQTAAALSPDRLSWA